MSFPVLSFKCYHVLYSHAAVAAVFFLAALLFHQSLARAFTPAFRISLERNLLSISSNRSGNTMIPGVGGLIFLSYQYVEAPDFSEIIINGELLEKCSGRFMPRGIFISN